MFSSPMCATIIVLLSTATAATASCEHQKHSCTTAWCVTINTPRNTDSRTNAECVERANDLNRNANRKNELGGTTSTCCIRVATDGFATTTMPKECIRAGKECIRAGGISIAFADFQILLIHCTKNIDAFPHQRLMVETETATETRCRRIRRWWSGARLC